MATSLWVCSVAEPFFILPTLDVLNFEGLLGVMLLGNKGFHTGGVRGAIMILIGPRIRDYVFRQLAVPLTRALRSALAWAPPMAATVLGDTWR
jgi:hypothetical protein